MSSPQSVSRSATSRCALCAKPVDARYRPFCSKRCADLDLKRWLDGAYALSDGGLRAVETEDGDEPDRTGG
ncbi:MAG: DNA gyrase inhibitor YacG [Maricaulaceae bacterium]